MSRNKGDGKQTQRAIRELDGILPENIDRRTFLTGTAAGIAMSALAGCTGGDGGNSDTGSKNGSGSGNKNVVWRQPWKAEPTWAFAHLASKKDYWNDRDISAPTVQNGTGSPDTVRRIGTGKAQIGHADIGSSIPGLAKGYKMKAFCITRQRSLLGFIYRKDRLDSPKDLAGKKVALASPFAEETWPVYPEAVGVDQSKVNAKFISEDITASLLSEGKRDAVWGAVDLLGTYQSSMPDGVQLGVSPLNKHIDVYGYPGWVNADWVSESGNIDYLTQVLEGYSMAAKWALLHPEQTLDFMINDVNSALQAQDRSDLSDQYKVTVAFTISAEVKKNGFGYFSEETFANTLDNLGEYLVDDPSKIPPASEIVLTEPMKNAELTTFSSDEWKQMIEYAGEFYSHYKSK